MNHKTIKFKKILSFLLVTMIAFSSFTLITYADEKQPSGLDLNCKAAVIIDVSSGKVLYSKNSEEKLSPASLTKIMTAILVMEAIEKNILSYESVVSCSAEASKMGGSQIWLEVGEQMTVDQLLKAVMIGSANDASVALAEAVAVTEEAFVDLMNLKAKDLSLTNTHFMNAAGLDAENHYTTAQDIAIMARELLNHQDITKYSTIWMDSLRDGKTELVNTNKLVRFYEGITGLKTGTTAKAGNCLVASAKRDNLHIASIIMGCTNNDDRYGGAKKMLDWGFANFTSYAPEDISSQLSTINVLKGIKQQATLSCEIDKTFIIKKTDATNVEYKITLAQDVVAPVEIGQTVGSVKILCNNEQIGEYPIKSIESIKKITFFNAFAMFFKGLISL